MENFGLRLEKLRDVHGYTKKEVSLKLGFSANVYGSYERGERRPSLETLVKLAELYDTSIDYLIRGKEYNSKNRSNFEDTIKDILEKNNITKFSLLELDKWRSLSKNELEEIDHHFEWVVEKARRRGEN